LLKFLQDWFTERDGTSACIARAIGTGAGVEAIYKFHTSTTPDYSSFGTCIAGIIAAIALKNWSEK
jgi:hypothetical protein